MKKIEEYERLLKSIEDYEKSLPGLEASFKEVRNGQAALNDAALKAEALKGPGWEEKVALAKRNAEKIRDLRETIEKTRASMDIIKPELIKLSPLACTEIRQSHWPRYEKILRTFISRLKEAEPLERELRQIQAEATDEMRKYGYNGFAAPFPVPFPILLETYGPRGDTLPGAFANLIAAAKEDGIEV
jgi:DNA repair exonuclease SbcCD ATPase subunit